MMRVTQMLAGRIGIAALDLVDEAVLEEEVERAIDGRRRDRFALAPRELVDDRVGAERRRTFGQNGQNLAAQRGQMKTLPVAGAFHLPLPAGGCRLGFGSLTSLWRCLFPHRRFHPTTAKATI